MKKWKGRKLLILDDILEKKIQNKIYLLHILFNVKLVSLEEVESYLNLKDFQVKEMISEINDNLRNSDSKIKLIRKKIYLENKAGIEESELTHAIYSTSYILDYFDFIINNNSEKNFSDFIDKYYLSHATAYRIRKKVKDYLLYEGLNIKGNVVVGKEYKIRYLIALLHYKFGVKYKKITNEDIGVARSFILAADDVTDNFLDITNKEYHFFEILVVLTWVRFPINLDTNEWSDFEKLKTLPIYKHLLSRSKKYLENRVKLSFSSEGYDYLYLAYLSTDNSLFVELWNQNDMDKVYEIILKNEKVTDLMNIIVENFQLGKHIISSPIFLVSILYLYKRFILNLQTFIPINRFLLPDNQGKFRVELENKISKFGKKWAVGNNISFSIEQSTILYFTYQIETLYTSMLSPTDLIIVTDSIVDYEILKTKIISEYGIENINPIIFLITRRSIKELSLIDNSIIVFEPKFYSIVNRFSKNNTRLVELSIEFFNVNINKLKSILDSFQEERLLNFLE